jgi:signal transduction histidine kinase
MPTTLPRRSKYYQHIIEETYRKGLRNAAALFLAYLVFVVFESIQQIYTPLLIMRISQFSIIIFTVLGMVFAYKRNVKQHIIPIYAIGMILSLANDLTICVLVHTIPDIPVSFTESHPAGILCYIMALSIGSLYAKVYCKIGFPILVGIYVILALVLNFDNPMNLILMTTLTLFLSYQMHQSQTQQRRLYGYIQQEIDTKDSEIQEINTSLAESNDKLTKMTYALTHDLKTPINNIKTFVELLDTSDQETFSDSSKMYLKVISDSANTMGQLVTSMYHYTNLNSNDKVEFVDVDMNKIFDQIKNNYLSQLDQGSVIINIRENPPTIKGMDFRIYMLFQNLIDNGIKYNEQPVKTITVSHQTTDKEIVYKVTDNGIGIPTEHLAYILEPFKRLHTNKKYQGTGLGLSICKEVMDKLDGTIEIVPNLDEGTTFTLTFKA